MNRPLPRPTAETRPFWDGCARGVVRYQQCARCGRVQLIPRSLCENCQAASLDWKDSCGYGRIHSYTVVHRAPTAAFREEVPYVIAVIDMEEGFRLMANVAGGAAMPLDIGKRVSIGFCRIDGSVLPQAEVCA